MSDLTPREVAASNDKLLSAWVDAEIDRGVSPADVVTELLDAVAYALTRAGHTSVDNWSPIIGRVVANRVRARVGSPPTEGQV